MSDVQKKKKKANPEAASEKVSVIQESTEASSKSQVSDEPNKSTRDQATAKITDKEKIPTPDSTQKGKKTKLKLMKPTTSLTTEAAIDRAPIRITKDELKKNTKGEKTSTLNSTQKQKNLKLKPKLKLVKPTPIAGPSKFGRIKFDKNFAKKPQQNSKVVKNNGLTDERLKAFGINPRRYNWKLKHAISTDNDNRKQNPNTSKKRSNNSNKFATSSKSQSTPPKKKRKTA